MTSFWVFQANPKMFDVDAALEVLDRIHWRVPQYTSAVAPGDGVVLWRSGPEAGVVGVGRVVGHPAEMLPAPGEETFTRDPGLLAPTTCAPVQVRPAPFVPKETVAVLAGWSKHQMMSRPTGTVFRISPSQWSALAPLLPELPTATPTESTALPPVFAWAQRRKDMYPMPGGYDSHLVSLRRLLTEVASKGPSREELETWACDALAVSESYARLAVGFLLRTGVLTQQGDTLAIGPVTGQWLETGDDTLIISLLHSRVRFVGELLAETVEPRTDTELLDIANRDYGAGWQTKTQIIRRRGWLQSAGLLAADDDSRLQTTVAGRAFLERLGLHPRSETPDTTWSTTEPVSPITAARATATSPETPPPPPNSPAAVALTVTDSVLTLTERLRATSTDRYAAEQFERETAEAFRRLGFRSEWRGGAGQTDVLLEADLGKDHRYRVVIDCKASSRGNVSQQIDWDTIDEHRLQHRADYAAIVAAGFGGGRLPDRAQRHDAMLITVENLIDLLVQHDRVPLGLDVYRLLFTSGTTDDAMAAISEIASEAERRVELMATVIDQIVERSPKQGPLSARDLELLLSVHDELPDAVETEIEPLLDTLASELLGIVRRDDRGGVRLTSSPATGAAMLRLLADTLDPRGQGEP